MAGDDRVWRQIMRHAAMQTSQAKESHVKVGVLSDDRGRESVGQGVTVIELAAIHEFGAPGAGVPERSFIRAAMKRHEKDLERVTAALARKYITGELSLEKALNQLGAVSSAWIKKFIADDQVMPPTGAEQNTRKNRRAGKPDDAETTTLIDTGRLMNAITWKVWLGRARDARGRFAK